jgi:hypothetical protein
VRAQVGGPVAVRRNADVVVRNSAELHLVLEPIDESVRAVIRVARFFLVQ